MEEGSFYASDPPSVVLAKLIVDAINFYDLTMDELDVEMAVRSHEVPVNVACLQAVRNPVNAQPPFGGYREGDCRH